MDCPVRVALRTKKPKVVAPIAGPTKPIKASLEANQEQILQLYDGGVGSVALAKDYGVSPAEMSLFLQSFGRKPKRGRRAKN